MNAVSTFITVGWSLTGVAGHAFQRVDAADAHVELLGADLLDGLGLAVCHLLSHWSKLGLTLSADEFTDAEAVAAVARITSGNFRLVQPLSARSSASWRSTT